MTRVKHIYQDLVRPQKLKKCLHGQTQNHNESFNSTVWQHAPKNRYRAFDKLELAINDGRQATLDIFENINIKPGRNTISVCSSLNIKRRRSSMHHSTTMWKKKRKMIRTENKRKPDANKSRWKDLPSWRILIIDL